MGISKELVWKYGCRVTAGVLMGTSFGAAIRAVADNKWGALNFENSTTKYEAHLGLWQYCGGFRGSPKTCQATNGMDMPQAYKAAIAMSMIGLILMVIAFVCLMITWCTIYAKKTGPLARYSIISIAALALLADICFLLAMAIFGSFFETWQKYYDYGPGKKTFLLSQGFYAILTAAINGFIATVLTRISAQTLVASEDLPMVHVISPPGQSVVYGHGQATPAYQQGYPAQYNTGYSDGKQ